jgi:hypothetical protein
VVTYLSRVSYMLQQGLFVADLAYLLDEGAPSSQPFWGGGLEPAPPEGYDYDTVNADALLNRMTVGDDGRLLMPDGMSYRILVLPRTDRMRPELLRKIRSLAAGGAIVVGPKPQRSPSLQGGAEAADLQVQALANELWGDLDGVTRNKRYFGKGLMIWGLPLKEVLSLANIPKDAEFAGPLDSHLGWIHRRAVEADIYFVANLTDRPQEIRARFRVEGKEAELWHPDTGEIEPAAYSISGKRTAVPLDLRERESVFVVFRRPAVAPARGRTLALGPILSIMDGPWDVAFPSGFGAPEKIRLEKLESWTASPDAGVKYFSGTATYTKTVEIEEDWLTPDGWLTPNDGIALNLGVVKDIAQVSINGRPVTTLWKPPYRADVTKFLKPGENRLEIRVTNQWTNRLLGDRGLGPEKRVLAPAAGGMGSFGPPPALAESGLLGPVTLEQIGRFYLDERPDDSYQRGDEE